MTWIIDPERPCLMAAVEKYLDDLRDSRYASNVPPPVVPDDAWRWLDPLTGKISSTAPEG